MFASHLSRSTLSIDAPPTTHARSMMVAGRMLASLGTRRGNLGAFSLARRDDRAVDAARLLAVPPVPLVLARPRRPPPRSAARSGPRRRRLRPQPRPILAFRGGLDLERAPSPRGGPDEAGASAVLPQ